MKHYSISAFFPCYNDKGTIASMIAGAHSVLEKLTDDFEVIVIDDGSTDGSRELLQELQRQYPKLKLVFHEKNLGYGGALRSGFAAATKDLIFYTDGDAQYDVKELTKLYEKLSDEVDVVNGFKIKRNDPWYRVLIGWIYQRLMKVAFSLKIKDVDCDFRLIRRSVFDRVNLTSTTGVICVEMIRKFGESGVRFAEVGVSHYHRTYGKSQIFNFRRLVVIMYRLVVLWFDLVVFKRNVR